MPRALSKQEFDRFRDELCVAATQLVHLHGIEALTMRMLAARMGGSTMRTYRYFRSKEDLVAEIRTWAFDEFTKALSARTGSTPEARAHAAQDAYADFALQNPGAYKLMFEVGPTDVLAYPELGRASARARELMTETVWELVETGLLKGNVHQLGLIFWAAVHGITTLAMSGLLGAGDPRELRRRMFEALINGFRA